MGMIKFFYEQYEEGMKYFEKELQVAHRRSTMALMRGKDKAFNIYQLRKKRNIPQRNYFGELSFQNFKVPSLPETTDQTAEAKIKGEAFGESVMEEMLFWNSKAQLSPEEIKRDGGGVYLSVFALLLVIVLLILLL